MISEFVENGGMGSDTPATWFIQEWMDLFKKRQADLVNDLGWPKGKAFKVWHRTQRYNEEIVNEIADWLHVRPYELLMPPKQALQMRAIHGFVVDTMAEPPLPPVSDEKPHKALKKRRQ